MPKIKKVQLLSIIFFLALLLLSSQKTLAQTSTSLLWPGDPLNDQLCVGNNSTSVKCSSNPNQTDVHDIAGTYIFIDSNGNRQIDADEINIPNRTGKCFCGRKNLTINNSSYGGNMSYAYCNQVTFAMSNADNFNAELVKLETTDGQLVLKGIFKDQYKPTVIIAKRFKVTNNGISSSLSSAVQTITITSVNLTTINLNKPKPYNGVPTTWVIFYGIQPQNTNPGNVCANYDTCRVTNDNDSNPANDSYSCTNSATNNVYVKVFIDTNQNSKRDTNEKCYAGSVKLNLDIRQVTNSTLLGGGSETYSSTADCTPIKLIYPRTGVARLNFEVTPSGYSFTGIDGNTNKFTIPPGVPKTVVIDATLANNNIDVEYGISSTTTNTANWFQTIGGNIRIDKDFIDNVPAGATCTNTTSPYVSINDLSLKIKDPGLLLSRGVINLGTANTASLANSKGWIINNYTKKYRGGNILRSSFAYAYPYFKKSGVKLLPMFGANAVCGNNSPNCQINSSAANGVYFIDKNVTIPSGSTYNLPSNKKYVFLIDGNLTINRDFNVPKGSIMQFIVSGDILIGENITNIEGLFSADNNFKILGNTSTANQNLMIEGAVVANAAVKDGKFINQRDLQSGNLSCPSVKIQTRPDFLTSAPDFMKYKLLNYSE